MLDGIRRPQTAFAAHQAKRQADYYKDVYERLRRTAAERHPRFYQSAYYRIVRTEADCADYSAA